MGTLIGKALPDMSFDVYLLSLKFSHEIEIEMFHCKKLFFLVKCMES